MVRVKGGSGRASVRWVMAGSAEAALAWCDANGYAEAVLVNDDSLATNFCGVRVFDGVELGASPRSIMSELNPSAARIYILAPVPYVLGLIGGFTVLGFLGRDRPALLEHPWPAGLFLTIAVLSLPFLISVYVYRGERGFHALQRAYVAGEWERVLDLGPSTARAFRRYGSVGASLQMETWKGRALAHLGRAEEGVRGLEVFRNHPSVPPASYFFQLSLVYGAAHDHERALACIEKAIALVPEDYIGWLSKAEVLAEQLGRPVEAREAIEKCRGMTMAQWARRAFALVEGKVLVAEGRHAEARPMLEAAVPMLERSTRQSPYAEYFVRTTYCQLVLACAGCGDREAAREYFRLAERFLRAQGDARAIGRCREVVGAWA